jgi:diguanylate cyclase (GGDEF)-like protein
MLPNIINQTKIKAKIYESSNSLVYQGVRNSDQFPLILKILKQEYPTPLELSRYRQEYEITHNLNITGVIQTYGLEKYQNRLVILFEDFGGESLRILMANRQFSLAEFFNIAMQSSQILGQIHQQHIIHKDINPANIVFNPDTGQIKLIDFGISTVLERENPTLKNPNILEGTLPYISPEQTGRMNRALDYRTDFYSLGATFYELLTKQRPFSATDPLEMVHCHLAKKPSSVHEINPQIPPIVSDIVMKLLAKNAEERYQSAYGLVADLENCWRQLQVNGSITIFPLAQQDVTQRLQISQKLYGREAEIQKCLAAFERVSQGNCELMLVSGYSGIGKSALVQELYKPITQQRGYFVTGKFEIYQRNTPYSAIIKAFQELVKQLLAESETQLNQWREKLLLSFGSNGRVITDVIPEIELIVGKQPDIPTLSPTATENRFNLVVQNFLQVFTQAEHPLVLFLDDLQWADGASLKLLQQILTAPDSDYFFLVGAYRDNEVNAAHPLQITLEKLQNETVSINRINLFPLNLPQLQEFIADSLQSYPSRVVELAELVLVKTQGNPFFVNEFLKSLYLEQLLYFDVETRAWQWNLAQIQAKGYTDNVIDLMVDKIQKLSEPTQSILQFAAAIGNRFDLAILAIANQTPLLQTGLGLQEALMAELILPLSDRYSSPNIFQPNTEENDEWLKSYASESIYQFTHDRIQQAAYSLIPPVQRPALHHKIGQLLLQNIPTNQLESRIFQLVNQLNLGIDYIIQPSERLQLASLNLMAGKKAKSAAAYESAFIYFITGIELLGNNSWQTEYQLSLELYVLATETAYLVPDFHRMEQLAPVAIAQAKTLLEKVPIYDIQIRAYIAQNQLSTAINKALEVLKLLGVKFPKKPSQLDSIRGMMRTKIALLGKSIESLANLPNMTESLQLAKMQILSTLSTAAYLGMPELYPLIVFQQFRLLVKHGNCAESAFIYATYGLILCGILNDLESGYKFGQLALQMLEKFNAKELQSNPARLKVLQLLTSQAAISLENARLYAEKEQYANTLEQKVAVRTAELEKANQELQRLATLDGLTKVANRRCFDEYFAQEWERLVREKQPLSLILCDVDYFKRYNDYYGHQGGDDCLRQVALAMSRAIKRPADLLARYGGEEFVVILPNTEVEGAVTVAEAIRAEMQQLKMPHAQSDVSEFVTLSLGVSSVIPSQSLAPESLIGTADEALYEAKKQGRNRMVFKSMRSR